MIKSRKPNRVSRKRELVKFERNRDPSTGKRHWLSGMEVYSKKERTKQEYYEKKEMQHRERCKKDKTGRKAESRRLVANKNEKAAQQCRATF